MVKGSLLSKDECLTPNIDKVMAVNILYKKLVIICVSSCAYLEGMVVVSLLSKDECLFPNIDQVMVVIVIYNIHPLSHVICSIFQLNIHVCSERVALIKSIGSPDPYLILGKGVLKLQYLYMHPHASKGT